MLVNDLDDLALKIGEGEICDFNLKKKIAIENLLDITNPDPTLERCIDDMPT
jgi:hypothetical protein